MSSHINFIIIVFFHVISIFLLRKYKDVNTGLLLTKTHNKNKIDQSCSWHFFLSAMFACATRGNDVGCWQWGWQYGAVLGWLGRVTGRNVTPLIHLSPAHLWLVFQVSCCQSHEYYYFLVGLQMMLGLHLFKIQYGLFITIHFLHFLQSIIYGVGEYHLCCRRVSFML